MQAGPRSCGLCRRARRSRWWPLLRARTCTDNVTLLQVSLPIGEFVTSINEAFRANHEGAAVLPPLVTGIEGKAAAVPLQLMQACRMQDNSIVLVGDSAHSVHPLAGQGLNLGLHDALSLVAHMSRAAAAGGAADDFLALQVCLALCGVLSCFYTTQAYERERLPINATWGAAIDFIGRTFGVQSPAVAFPRGLVLSLLNATTPLKQQIIFAASGEGGNHLQNLEELK
jgi:2-polyprenyl-6-methoxyphenol hydroxylase-like FAD-dependent oxidoreductase